MGSVHIPIPGVALITATNAAMVTAALPQNPAVRLMLAKPTSATTEPALRATPIAATTTATVANTFTAVPA